MQTLKKIFVLGDIIHGMVPLEPKHKLHSIPLTLRVVGPQSCVLHWLVGSAGTMGEGQPAPPPPPPANSVPGTGGNQWITESTLQLLFQQLPLTQFSPGFLGLVVEVILVGPAEWVCPAALFFCSPIDRSHRRLGSGCCRIDFPLSWLSRVAFLASCGIFQVVVFVFGLSF